jgi:hypothetical protein
MLVAAAAAAAATLPSSSSEHRSSLLQCLRIFLEPKFSSAFVNASKCFPSLQYEFWSVLVVVEEEEEEVEVFAAE